MNKREHLRKADEAWQMIRWTLSGSGMSQNEATRVLELVDSYAEAIYANRLAELTEKMQGG